MTEQNENLNQDEVLARLKALNPYPQGDSSHPKPQRAQDALFEEITMNTYDTTAASQRVTGPRWWQQPITALPAFAVFVAVLLGGAVIANTVAAPSAYALVTQAADNSAAFKSGRVTVVTELFEIPDESTVGSTTIEFRYDGEDSSLLVDSSDLEMGQLGPPEGDDSLALATRFEFREVDGITYSSFEPGSFIKSSEDRTRVEGADQFAELFGFDKKALRPDTVVALLESAEDFRKTSSEDGSTVFEGTVTLEAILKIGQKDLPAGLALLAEGGTDDLPEEISIQVTVMDELLSKLVVDIDGDTPTGYTKGRITSTFGAYGEDQRIVAPSPDQITDGADLFGLPEGMEEQIAIMEDLDTRRPGLCNDAFEAFEEDSSVTDPEEFEAVTEVFVQCLVDAGEPEAAEAFRLMTGISNN